MLVLCCVPYAMYWRYTHTHTHTSSLCSVPVNWGNERRAFSMHQYKNAARTLLHAHGGCGQQITRITRANCSHVHDMLGMALSGCTKKLLTLINI